MAIAGVRPVLMIAALSAVFFFITATTFASLGIVLPAMIAEFRWTWTEAGSGFTVLALFVGLFSPLAAASLKRFGVRGNYLAGGLLMAGGYIALAMVRDVSSYLVGAALLGAGFALLANVPSVYVIGTLVVPERRNLVIGAYLAAGGLGGVAGPFFANALIDGGGEWRDYWRTCFVISSLLAATVVALAGGSPGGDREKMTARVAPALAPADGPAWTLAAALRAPAFYVLAGALTVAYFCGVTVSTWAVVHLEANGLPMAFAVSMLSLYAAVNAGARGLGGVAAKSVSPRLLLVSGLAAQALGMTMLATADSPRAAIVFAVFDGYAFGMILFATTSLQLRYFGLSNSPALLGAMNLAATVAMLGPVVTGMAGDQLGGFAPVFFCYALAATGLGAAALLMRDPNPLPRAPQGPAPPP